MPDRVFNLAEGGHWQAEVVDVQADKVELCFDADDKHYWFEMSVALQWRARPAKSRRDEPVCPTARTLLFGSPKKPRATRLTPRRLVQVDKSHLHGAGSQGLPPGVGHRKRCNVHRLESNPAGGHS